MARYKIPNVSDSVRVRPILPLCWAVLSPFAYQGIAVLCLRHWTSATPWTDLDVFSGGFFALTAILLLYEIPFRSNIFHSRERLREASGLSYDADAVKWGGVIAVADLSVFLDYGHWHLLPALRVPALQATGLALYACAMAGIMWADTWLARQFQMNSHDRQLMTTGPFGIVRHPRYAGLLMAKLGVGLIFASVFAWVSVLASIILVRRRIRLEEDHLTDIFGTSYDTYAQTTDRLFPGLY
jgi:protein-S-isoprenylcysteine O-methyltransferase Ste14